MGRVAIAAILLQGLLVARPLDSWGAGPCEDGVELNRLALEAVEKGDFGRAVVLLRRARRLEPDNAILRANLSQVHSRWGASLARAGKLRDARDQLGQAVALEKGDANLHARLGAVQLELGSLEDARRSLLEAIRLDPRNAGALESLGSLHYRERRFREAIRSWEKSLALDPDNEGLRQRCERTRRELAVEEKFLSSRGALFDISYDAGIDTRVVDEARAHLTRAYHDVGAALSFYPDRVVPVVLYYRSGFSHVIAGNRWVGGVFDGKIRVPLERRSLEGSRLEKTLVHEYTHFVVYRLAPRCPAWLHEGIAQWQEGRRPEDVRDLLARARRTGKLPRVFGLTDSFASTEDPAVVKVHYAVALSFVLFLVDRYGAPSVGELLRSIDRKGSVEEAMRAVYRSSPGELEAAWLATLS